MNRSLRLSIVLAACAGVGLPVATASGASPLLFSITAGGSVVSKSGARYAITLPERSNMAWFTDRPARRAGTADAGSLVDGWSVNRFDVDPPNAALVMTRKGVSQQVVVTLLKGERRGTNVVFTARVLRQGATLGRQSTARLAAGRYGSTQLFIDDGTVPPCGYQSSNRVAVDCTLGAGDGWASLGRPSRYSNGVSLTVTGASAATTTVTHGWSETRICDDQFCLVPQTTSETLTSPFSRQFGAVPTGSRFEYVRVAAPTTPGAVLRVQMAPR